MNAVLSRWSLIAACLLVMPTFGGNEIAFAQSSLKKCPKSQNVRWHNCFGTYTHPGAGQASCRLFFTRSADFRQLT